MLEHKDKQESTVPDQKEITIHNPQQERAFNPSEYRKAVFAEYERLQPLNPEAAEQFLAQHVKAGWKPQTLLANSDLVTELFSLF